LKTLRVVTPTILADDQEASMKRLAALLPMILAALLSLVTLATVSDDADGRQGSADGPLSRSMGFAVRFLMARLFWS
jgi:hypothetical protein